MTTAELAAACQLALRWDVASVCVKPYAVPLAREILAGSGVAFAKASIGYGFVKQPDGHYAYAGATDHDLALMRRECAPAVQIKAASGVRTLDDLLRVRSLGATRAGATATESIRQEARRRGY
jgi:deoxyribose-phosphate aldolase